MIRPRAASPTKSMISDDLPALQTKIFGELSRRPEYFVTHPAELHVIQQLTRTELDDFARKHGWRVIRRVGGRQFQFYNDTYARMQS
jgi:hypothetical protein